MANNSIVASIGKALRIPRTVQEQSVVINGNVYKNSTWNEMDQAARSPGVSVSYRGIEMQIQPDWTGKAFHILQVTKTGRFETFQVAIEA